jgi:hypothetical protein
MLFTDFSKGASDADPLDKILHADTRDALNRVAWKVLKLILVAIGCALDLVVRLLQIIPVIILTLVIAYMIIIARFGVVLAARIIDDALKILLGIVNGALSIGSFLGFGSHHLHARDIVGGWIDTVLAIPKTCRRFASWQDELFMFGRLLTHNTLCTAVRYTYAIPWLFEIMDGMFGWLILDPTPGAEDGNCKRPRGAWLCWALGLGFFLRDFVVAFTIALQFVVAFLPILKEFVKLTLLFGAVLRDQAGKVALQSRAWYYRKYPSKLKRMQAESAAPAHMAVREPYYEHDLGPKF